MNTVANYPYNNPSVDLTAFASQWRRKYYALVYQGDVSEVSRAENSIVFNPTDFLPTGGICSIDSNTGFAVADVPAGTNGNHPCPYFIMVGNDKQEVLSEVGNTAGGRITAIPCDGYYRVRTTVFDKSPGVTYKVNDFLGVVKGTEAYSQKETCMVSTANNKPYEDVIVGQVTQVVDKNKEGLDSLSFSLHFIPVQEA